VVALTSNWPKLRAFAAGIYLLPQRRYNPARHTMTNLRGGLEIWPEMLPKANPLNLIRLMPA